jgi:hypothetical protein
LTAEGIFVGWGDGGVQGIFLQRDLGVAGNENNNNTPAEMFTYRPDFLLSAPDFLRKPSYYWQEIKPFPTP